MCGATWPEPNVCHVCGQPAQRGSRWETYEVEPPAEPAVDSLIAAGVAEVGIQPGEGGHLDRRELRRWMRKLYGRHGWRSRTYRHAWSTLLGEFFSGASLGERAYMDHERLKREKEAKEEAARSGRR